MKIFIYPLLSIQLFALSLSLGGHSVHATAERPNVVFILIDDLSHYGVSAYGGVELNSTQGYFDPVPIATPEIDRLAAEGVLAGNAFAYPICEPTRVALMTGMNNHRNFVKAKALHESQITFGDLFKQAGYATGIAGKWKQSRGTAQIPGEDYVDQFGWDEIHCFDLLYEGPRHIDPNFVINGKIQWFKDSNPETDRRYYGPNLVNRFALDFIERHQEEPFFLYYPMLLVHDEHTPTPDTKPHDLYDHFDVMTHTGVSPENKYGAFKGDDRRYFPDMMAYMDKMIGRVTNKLDELNLRDNTLIIIMGDNGTKESFSYTLADGTEFVGGKGQCKINGLQVPLILSYPGTIDPGIQYDGLINLTDLLPTICEAAGITLPNEKDIDGISFWPQVTRADPDVHREHIYTWYNANRPMTDPSKLLRYAQEINFKRYAPDANFPEGRFFDLRNDPFERSGEDSVKFNWNNWHHSGLNVDTLTAEQRAAYDRLGEVLKKNAYRPVTDLKIKAASDQLKVHESIQLEAVIQPEEATMRNVIWESSDPAIASIDKFGTVQAVQPGTVTIALYSWDDTRPVASGKNATYQRNGCTDKIRLQIEP
jgi:arylsulfatase A-like enzyme